MSKKEPKPKKKAPYVEVYEAAFGLVPPGKCVHHCDSNHSNDIASNLVAISRGHHFILHRLMRQLPLDVLFKIGEGLINFCRAESKRRQNEPK